MIRRRTSSRFNPIAILILILICFSSVTIAQQNQQLSLEQIGSSLVKFVSSGDSTGLISLSENILTNMAPATSDSLDLAELYYYAGVCQLFTQRYNKALTLLQFSVDIKKRTGVIDDHFAKGLFNIGVVFNYMGDFDRVIELMLRYIDAGRKIYGLNSPEIVSAYSTIIGATLENKDYEKFKEYTFLTLEILNLNRNILTDTELSSLYLNIGAGYGRLSDYAKARIYFEEAESILNRGGLIHDQYYINLINNLAITYGRLGLTEKEAEYYERGIALAETSNSYLAYNMINSFAIELGNTGNISRGEELLSSLIKRADHVFGEDSRFYYEVIKNYAEYQRIKMNDYPNSLKYYTLCFDYLKNHEDKTSLRDQVITGYALALTETGASHEALETIQELLFSDISPDKVPDLYENPDPGELKADNRTLNIFRAKYKILWQLYKESDEFEILISAAATSEIIIYLIDKIRLNISEEESRIILGDNYRRSYLNSIRDFELCFRKTGEQRFLEKVFEYAEKSKVAGLLAATRELNAVNFHIPQPLAELERSLQRKVSYYNSRIYDENEKRKPDDKLISEWNKNLLNAINKRDSLIMTYEREYPEYFNLKYNTIVPLMKEVPGIAGHNVNYLNYVVSDSLVYIMLVNRKHQFLATVEIDSLFIKRITDFREQLSNPEMSQQARSKFTSYKETAYYFYRTLIEPVRRYFISSYLLISPDNLLSYIPFETILCSDYEGEAILYRELPYLMNDFSISYAYSVSFVNEAGKAKQGRTKNLVAFAPMYTGGFSLDSLYMKREATSIILDDLPFARQEAEYVARISHGVLYLSNNARESVFKAEAGKYDIIHLAMHTYLNDRNPMNSAMIFTQNGDSPEDGLLHTFEVYGIPLKAKMVVLSSCNTGSGTLSSGEGIMSLARGFLYSGSQSVVMSMWDIEDQSGTEIIELFYDNLLKGKSKSVALKKARSEYLKHANQLKSHPYFWSSLVVYGDDNAVYSSQSIHIAAGAFILIMLVISFYRVWKRRYS